MNQEAVWDAIAEQWYHFRQQQFKDVLEELEKISRQRKGKILEVGCGNCRNLLPFARAGFECYGIDFSKNMLKYAKIYCKKHGFKVKLKKAKAEELPFKSNFFDYLLSIAVLHHLKKEDQEKAVEEIRRVLKPNGIALIAVWNKFPLSLFVKERYIPWKIKGKTYLRYYYFFTPWELKKLMKKHGFEIIKGKCKKNIILIVKKT